MKNTLVNLYKALLFMLTLAFTLPMVHKVTGSWVIAILFAMINEGNLIFWPFVAGNSKTISEFKLCVLMTTVAIITISLGVVLHILDSQKIIDVSSANNYVVYYLTGTIICNLFAVQVTQLLNPDITRKIANLKIHQEVEESSSAVSKEIQKRQRLYDVFQEAKELTPDGWAAFIESKQKLSLPKSLTTRFENKDKIENPSLATGRHGSGKKIHKRPKKN